MVGMQGQEETKSKGKYRKARIAWAKEYLNWMCENCNKVIFSDKRIFSIQYRAGNNYVRRRSHEAFSSQYILPTIKHPANVMIWGYTTLHGISKFHICEGKMITTTYAAVLEMRLVSIARILFREGNWIFQDGNAPCHRATFVKKWMQSHRECQMNWSS